MERILALGPLMAKLLDGVNRSDSNLDPSLFRLVASSFSLFVDKAATRREKHIVGLDGVVDLSISRRTRAESARGIHKKDEPASEETVESIAQVKTLGCTNSSSSSSSSNSSVCLICFAAEYSESLESKPDVLVTFISI
jgi:hypothetical protein